MELKKVIQDLKKLRTEETLKINDEVLFDGALRLFISNNIQNSKQLATEQQKRLMKKLKIEFKSNITKKEAQELISKKLK